MTVDELIISIALKLDPKALSGLKDISKQLDALGENAGKSGDGLEKAAKKNDKATKLAEKNTTKLMKVFASRNKSFADNIRVTDLLTRSMRSFAVAAIGGASAGAAFSLMVKNARAGKELQDVANSLGLNASQLGLWESAVRSAGYSAETFRSDLKNIFGEVGDIDFDEILEHAQILSQMSEKEATHHGRLLGWSDPMIQWLRQGADKIQEQIEKSRRLGHEQTAEQIKKNAELTRAWATTLETIDRTIDRVTAALSPGFVKALDEISKALGDNQKLFEEWGASVGNKVAAFVNEAVGKIDTLENRMAAFNKKPASENIASPDEATRDAQFNELRDDAQGRILWDIGRTAVGLIGNLADLLEGEVNFGKTLGDAAARRKRIMDPIERARYHEQRLTRGDESFAIDQLVVDIRKQYPNAPTEDLQALARSRLGLSAPATGAGHAEILRQQGVPEDVIRDVVAGVTPEMRARVEKLNYSNANPGNDSNAHRLAAQALHGDPSFAYIPFDSWSPESKIAEEVTGVYYPPVSPTYSDTGTAPDVRQPSPRGSGGAAGVHVENQYVTVEINGAADPAQVGDRVFRAINHAAQYGDNIPFIQ